MYVVAHCMLDNGTPILQAVFLCKTSKEAEDMAVKLAVEQLTEEGDDNVATVLEELQASDSYYDPNGEWSVCVTFVS